MKKTDTFTIFLLFLTAMIWGFSFVAQVSGVSHVGPFTMNGTRFAVGAISLLPVVLIFEKGRTNGRERRRTVVASLLAGLALFCASSLQQLGIAYTGSAGISGFITGLYTVFVPIVCFVFFRYKTGLGTWLGAICAVGGLFLLCYRPGEGLHFGLGEWILLLGSLGFTAHIVIVDRVSQMLRPLHFAWGQFAVCAILCLSCMFLFEEPEWQGILAAKWAILYCGVLSVGVAYTLQVISQRRADPTFATIVLSTESVFSAVGGALFGMDSISVIGYVGCGLIFGGILLSQLTGVSGGKKKKDSLANPEGESGQ